MRCSRPAIASRAREDVVARELSHANASSGSPVRAGSALRRWLGLVEPAEVADAGHEQHGQRGDDEVADRDPERRRDPDRIRHRAGEDQPEREERERAHPVPGAHAGEGLLRDVLLERRLPDGAEEAHAEAADSLRRGDHRRRSAKREQRHRRCDEHRRGDSRPASDAPASSAARGTRRRWSLRPEAGGDQPPRRRAAQGILRDHRSERQEWGDDDAAGTSRPTTTITQSHVCETSSCQPPLRSRQEAVALALTPSAREPEQRERDRADCERARRRRRTPRPGSQPRRPRPRPRAPRRRRMLRERPSSALACWSRCGLTVAGTRPVAAGWKNASAVP